MVFMGKKITPTHPEIQKHNMNSIHTKDRCLLTMTFNNFYNLHNISHRIGTILLLVQYSMLLR